VTLEENLRHTIPSREVFKMLRDNFYQRLDGQYVKRQRSTGHIAAWLSRWYDLLLGNA
jgi:hypothetical protein